jgi:hypothetical protein
METQFMTLSARSASRLIAELADAIARANDFRLRGSDPIELSMWPGTDGMLFLEVNGSPAGMARPFTHKNEEN